MKRKRELIPDNNTDQEHEREDTRNTKQIFADGLRAIFGKRQKKEVHEKMAEQKTYDDIEKPESGDSMQKRIELLQKDMVDQDAKRSRDITELQNSVADISDMIGKISLQLSSAPQQSEPLLGLVEEHEQDNDTQVLDDRSKDSVEIKINTDVSNLPKVFATLEMLRAGKQITVSGISTKA